MSFFVVTKPASYITRWMNGSYTGDHTAKLHQGRCVTCKFGNKMHVTVITAYGHHASQDKSQPLTYKHLRKSFSHMLVFQSTFALSTQICFNNIPSISSGLAASHGFNWINKQSTLMRIYYSTILPLESCILPILFIVFAITNCLGVERFWHYFSLNERITTCSFLTMAHFFHNDPECSFSMLSLTTML